MSVLSLGYKAKRNLFLAGGTLVSALTASTAFATTIDVLVLYTPGVESKYAGNPTTRFNHLFNVSNQVYADSGVDLQVRLAGAVKVNYADTGSADTALDDMTYGRSVFSNVEALRSQYKADMVLFYRVYGRTHGSCGLAWVNPGEQGNLSGEWSRKYMYAHVGIDACPDHTTVHELGHNMGLNHSRVQDGSGGTFPHALGYGVSGVFTDVMAYTSVFGVDYWTGTVYKLSNPAITCRGLPCGVDRSQADGADAAHAVSQVASQIAAYYDGNGAGAPSQLALLAEKLAQAEQARNAANAARDAQLAVSNQANAALVRAKAAVDAIKRRGGTSLTNYQTKVATLARQNQSLTTWQNKITQAQAKITAARTPAIRTAAERELAAAQTGYQKQAALLQTLQSQVQTLYASLSGLLGELEQATNALTAATTLARDEKARYETLRRAAVSADASYKSAKAEYDRLRKSLK
jgi:hypothetical protein